MIGIGHGTTETLGTAETTDKKDISAASVVLSDSVVESCVLRQAPPQYEAGLHVRKGHRTFIIPAHH
jgi:hypothetical protein